MNTLLFGISLSALLSFTSLMIVLLRVSPLTSPNQAIPAFFLSMFLTVTTVSMLLFMMIWKRVPHHSWDTAKLMTISLRQALFLGSAVVLVLLFHMFQLLNWWIMLMIFAVFALVELALDH